ncbi:hypothetical protein DY000_02040976 [Brassica cretica]|uniref:Uncharacterized protein n=1 Tax=Brassica cretica TaxID=69181 RepID=A0ABQ7BG91_BRACR|nr:hypothetical protein DY000_02040976 [Brassica cretica]
MGDHGGQDDLTAAIALMQQQMQQMQQTINSQEAARQAAAELAAQQGNQSQVFIMEEAASENYVSDTTPKGYNTTDKLVENAQNSQGQSSGYQKPYQRRKYVLNQAQHNQFQNQKQQTSQQTASSPTTASQDEMKGLATMMQQMLQASHMRQMDVQIAQTAESVKRQQGTLPGKTDKNPKECSAVALRSGRTLPDAVPKKLSAAEKGKQKEEGMIEEILTDDPLELALNRSETRHNVMRVDADGYNKMLTLPKAWKSLSPI